MPTSSCCQEDGDACGPFVDQEREIDRLKVEIERLRAERTDKATAWEKLTEKNAEIERLRAALEPFGEIAHRMGWKNLADDAPEINDHIIDAPADDIAPGAFYCLMVSAFIEAHRTIHRDEQEARTTDEG
jgi:hypothetical protein